MNMYLKQLKSVYRASSSRARSITAHLHAFLAACKWEQQQPQQQLLGLKQRLNECCCVCVKVMKKVVRYCGLAHVLVITAAADQRPTERPTEP